MPLAQVPKISECTDNKLILIVDLLEFSLDGIPDRLRKVIYEKLKEMKEY
jgi:hypothetical protein